MKSYRTRALHPYGCTLYQFTKESAFHRYLKREGMPAHTISPTAHATTVTYSRPGRVLIFVVLKSESWDKVPSTAKLAGLCFHEAVHVWQTCCDEIGERNPGTEIEAYSIQGIGQWLLQGALFDLETGE